MVTRRDAVRTLGASAFVTMDRSISIPVAALAQVVAPAPPEKYANVLTHHNDNARTGANLNEAAPNVANVSTRFGRLFERQVNGAVYAQPLIARVNVSNRMRNVLYVATMRNLVYAFDADDPKESAPLWGPVSLGPAVPLPDARIGGDAGYKDIAWEVGILSTPVIDLDRDAIYVVAATKETVPTHRERDVVVPGPIGELEIFRHRLHKLDLSTGALINSSQPIAAAIDNASLRSGQEQPAGRAGAG
jgi:hypothetical protein